MIGEIDLTGKENKAKFLCDYLYELRDRCGGLIMFLLIPPAFKELMYNVKTEPSIPESDHFYFYGYYDVLRGDIYVDTSLTEWVYLVGNTKTVKIKVING